MDLVEVIDVSDIVPSEREVIEILSNTTNEFHDNSRIVDCYDTSSPVRLLPLNLSPVHSQRVEVVESSFSVHSQLSNPVNRVLESLETDQDCPKSEQERLKTSQTASKTLENSPKSHESPVKSHHVLDLVHWLSSELEQTLSSQVLPSKKTILTISEGLSGLFVQCSSDPISQCSSSPIKPPPKPRQRAQRTVKSTNISTNNGFLYTAKELREANKVTRKKEELLSEMIINFPNQLISEKFNIDHIKEIVQHAKVETYDCDLPIIFWKRNIKAEYDSINDVFIPCRPKIVVEKTLVLYYKADAFMVKLKDKSLANDISQSTEMAKARENIKYNIIVVIEGYDQYLAKLKNVENKRFRDGILMLLDGQGTNKRRKENDSLVDLSEKQVQDLMNETQIELGVNMFPVRSSQEVLQWLYSFTYTISHSLYDKWERNQSLANLGRVKSGVDTKSTFLNSICQFRLMTEAKAERLYGFHPSIYSIYNKFKQDGSLGNDDFNRGLVPPSTEIAMRRTFLSNNPEEVVND